MLKGLPLTALQQAYEERVRLNPGARTLVRTMAANGARCVLVSGGFSYFTSGSPCWPASTPSAPIPWARPTGR